MVVCDVLTQVIQLYVAVPITYAGEPVSSHVVSPFQYFGCYVERTSADVHITLCSNKWVASSDWAVVRP